MPKCVKQVAKHGVQSRKKTVPKETPKRYQIEVKRNSSKTLLNYKPGETTLKSALKTICHHLGCDMNTMKFRDVHLDNLDQVLHYIDNKRVLFLDQVV